jgi:NitT/TauT family transport system substrate-binding protein
MKTFTIFALLACCLGCGQTNKVGGPDPNAVAGVNGTTTRETGQFPSFTVTSSEYPSWSTLMVADKAGIINGKKGALGDLEKKWGIDLVLEVKDYEACLISYGNSQCDATCMTNIDALNPAMSVPSTAICPTSTSAGADKVIVVGINSIDDLKGTSVYGLEKSVSQYLFVRGLEKKGLKASDFKFENLDPAVAATRLQSAETTDKKAIDVWNPYALQTLRSNKNCKTLFDPR